MDVQDDNKAHSHAFFTTTWETFWAEISTQTVISSLLKCKAERVSDAKHIKKHRHQSVVRDSTRALLAVFRIRQGVHQAFGRLIWKHLLSTFPRVFRRFFHAFGAGAGGRFASGEHSGPNPRINLMKSRPIYPPASASMRMHRTSSSHTHTRTYSDTFCRG